MSLEEWAGYDVSQATLDEAAKWLVKLDAVESEATSTAENKHMLAFYEWLEQDPSHQQAYYELSELWAKSACIKGAGHLLHTSTVLNFSVSDRLNDKTNSLEDTSLPMFAVSSPVTSVAAPATYYKASIALILFGLFIPFFQSLL